MGNNIVWNFKRMRLGGGSTLNFQRGKTAKASFAIRGRITSNFQFVNHHLAQTDHGSRIKIDQAGVGDHTEK